MRMPLLLAVVVAACDPGGTSSAEMEAAAVERARDELGLAADVPLQAEVWVGRGQHEGQTVLCGTVSGSAPGSKVTPKRFAATVDPVDWLIFENAHASMAPSQPDKFPEWRRLCGSDGSPS